MKKIISIVLDACTIFWAGVIEFANELFGEGQKKVYDASFIKVSDLASLNERGFVINGRHSISIKQSYSNMLVLGGTSSGKSSIILAPTIWRMAKFCSLIVHDPSNELRQMCSPFLHSINSEVLSLNLANPERSVCFNPLIRAKSISSKKKLSKMLVRGVFGTKDMFWSLNGENVLTLSFRILEHQEPQYRNLYNASYLINCLSYGHQGVLKLVIRTGDEALINDFKSALSMEPKVFQNVISTCQAALSLYSDPGIARVTSKDTFNIEDFRTTRKVLFINNSVADISYYAGLTNVFFEQTWGEIMSKFPSNTSYPIFSLLDEASSLHLGSTLGTALSNIRKYSSGIMHVYQHYNQMVNIYGSAEATNLAANSQCQVYLPGQSNEVATMLQNMVGKFEYEEDGQRRIRPLATSDEIRMMDEAIVILGNKAPIKTKLYPYYKQPKLKHYASMKAPELCNSEKETDLPLIALPE